MRPMRGVVLPFTKSDEDATPFTPVGNSADSRRGTKLRAAVSANPHSLQTSFAQSILGPIDGLLFHALCLFTSRVWNTC
jgi:hypothetical protein